MFKDLKMVCTFKKKKKKLFTILTISTFVVILAHVFNGHNTNNMIQSHRKKMAKLFECSKINFLTLFS